MEQSYKNLVSYIEKQLKSRLRDGFLYFSLIVHICNYYEKYELNGDEKHSKICHAFSRLREVEDNVRNVTAHSITNVTEEKMRRIMKIDSKDVLAELHTVIKIVRGSDIPWGYDRLNQCILDSLRK